MRAQQEEEQTSPTISRGAEISLPFLSPTHPTDLCGLRDLVQFMWISEGCLVLTSQFILIPSHKLHTAHYTRAPCDTKRRYSAWENDFSCFAPCRCCSNLAEATIDPAGFI